MHDAQLLLQVTRPLLLLLLQRALEEKFDYSASQIALLKNSKDKLQVRPNLCPSLLTLLVAYCILLAALSRCVLLY